ncbi:MAG: adenylate/guanylate cyclase domain-containing protein [Desulfamplus sp.]|nr:adenylate/guanylate cyclase domain-containing protein [Desulfamplus sp.]
MVKTIGDAVMATFSKPDDGLHAAFDMIDRINQMNQKKNTREPEISIKVGLHCGTALAVTANEVLDFFGQTINIAARVQGLAQGGEIWITNSVYNNEEIKNILESYPRKIEKHSAILKGIKEPTIVYRIT